MSLCDGSVGSFYEVQEIMVAPNITRRLEALGVNEGTTVEILNQKRNKGALIIKVRGTRLALGRQIAEGILVKEAAANE